MKLIDFIVCDDIRFEMGNKHTLIGIYSDINLPFKKGNSKPENILYKMGIFIRLMISPTDVRPDAFKLDFIHSSQRNIPSMEGTLNIPTGVKFVNLALVKNFTIPGEGKIDFKLSFFKEGKIVETVAPLYSFNINFVESK